MLQGMKRLLLFSNGLNDEQSQPGLRISSGPIEEQLEQHIRCLYFIDTFGKLSS